VDGPGPGRVYVGISDGQRTDVLELDLPGDRAAVRGAAVDAAVTALLDRLGRPGCGNARPGDRVTP
jgi:nicotinamide-nucleotide amidase